MAMEFKQSSLTVFLNIYLRSTASVHFEKEITEPIYYNYV